MALCLEKLSDSTWVLMDGNVQLAEISNQVLRIDAVTKLGVDLISPSASELAAINGLTSSAAELNILDGVTKTTEQINLLIAGAAGGYKIARGQYTMLSASDTIATGLATVVSAMAFMESDPILTFDRATCQIGNQSGSPAAGSIILKGWMPTGAALTTPIAAIGYANIKVNWIAIGT